MHRRRAAVDTVKVARRPREWQPASHVAIVSLASVRAGVAGCRGRDVRQITVLCAVAVELVAQLASPVNRPSDVTISAGTSVPALIMFEWSPSSPSLCFVEKI